MSRDEYEMLDTRSVIHIPHISFIPR